MFGRQYYQCQNSFGSMPFPYIPIEPLVRGNMAFENTESGEILEFDASYRDHLDAVENVLRAIHSGDYTQYYSSQSEGIIY